MRRLLGHVLRCAGLLVHARIRIEAGFKRWLRRRRYRPRLWRLNLGRHQPTGYFQTHFREHVIEEFERFFFKLVQRIALAIRAQVNHRAQLVNLLQMLAPAPVEDLQ